MGSFAGGWGTWADARSIKLEHPVVLEEIQRASLELAAMESARLAEKEPVVHLASYRGIFVYPFTQAVYPRV